MATIAIVGYEQQGYCQHCGRALKHCVRLGDGSIVGADCFDKKLTKPKVSQGKAYRVGAERIRELAKVAQFWTPSRQALAGYYPSHFVFESA